MSMSTAVITATVVCPGCGTSLDVPDGQEALRFLACTNCASTLVLVPPQPTAPPGVAVGTAPTASEKTAASRPSHKGRAQAVPASTGMPRAAWIALGTLCAVAYACVALVFFGASLGVKRMPPYQSAESFVRQHPLLKQTLGEPMTFGWFPTAQMHGDRHKKTGYVELTVDGPLGSAQVALNLLADKKQWQVVEAEYAIGEADAQPLWVQFPGDFALRAQVEDVVSAIDDATQSQDMDGMTAALAPDVQVTVMLETPPPRRVQTFHGIDAYRREVLSDMLMKKHVDWSREDSLVRLTDDGQHATGTYRWTHEVLVENQPQTIRIDGTLTFAFHEGQATITTMELVHQVIGASR